MALNFNGLLLDQWPAELWAVQRGLYFGDTFFESIRVLNGRIPLLEAHWERLLGGLKAMDYQIPSEWTIPFWEKEILRVTRSPNARVRLTVWRTPGGYYFPENDQAQFLITALPLESAQFEWSNEGLKTGLIKSVRLPVDAWSGYKTLNAARYVAAAKEAHSMGWDDGIILNAYERVCEACSSNVFWFEGSVLCTPPLSDGCVTGTMRKILLLLRAQKALPVQEKAATFATLLAADELLLTNAIRGIRWVREFEGKVYEHHKTKALFQEMVDTMNAF
ncbi:MAG: aminotransferase class IV [Saprospiraceae bacterium]|nr:aminotransferase class IV [Saprospiraceae bacterium]